MAGASQLVGVPIFFHLMKNFAPDYRRRVTRRYPVLDPMRTFTMQKEIFQAVLGGYETVAMAGGPSRRARSGA
ncbi:MAG: hypothetical protein HY647_08680 [Acidobacteria bacterium]|nr:hypothetical protein [Acidobacteriota bacterium]